MRGAEAAAAAGALDHVVQPMRLDCISNLNIQRTGNQLDGLPCCAVAEQMRGGDVVGRARAACVGAAAAVAAGARDHAAQPMRLDSSILCCSSRAGGQPMDYRVTRSRKWCVATDAAHARARPPNSFRRSVRAARDVRQRARAARAAAAAGASCRRVGADAGPRRRQAWRVTGRADGGGESGGGRRR